MNLIQTFMDSVDQNIFAELHLRLISVLQQFQGRPLSRDTVIMKARRDSWQRWVPIVALIFWSSVLMLGYR